MTKTSLPPIGDYVARIEAIWESGWITNNGPLVRQLSGELEKYLETPFLELVANGTLALQLAIKALGLKGEVITTPYSYVATTSAILWEGCDPVFVDIEGGSFCINADLIEGAITERTSGIIATHVYGYPCELEKIESIAQKYNLKVIYDAAHAFGVRFNGRPLAANGDCSALSFHATKPFHTGEGGAVVSSNEGVRNRISLMKKFGHIGEEEYLDIGVNAKMSELHAAVGLCMLPRVAEEIAGREACAESYNELLDTPLVRKPQAKSSLEYNFAFYPVVLPSPDHMMRARNALLDSGTKPRRYFYPSLNTLPFLKPQLRRSCPVSEDISSRVLSLPMYNGLQRSEIEVISRIVRSCLKD